MLTVTALLFILAAPKPAVKPADPCYKNVEAKAYREKSSGMPIYLELLGAYRTPKDPAGAKSRVIEITLLRDGENCFALIDFIDGKQKRRGLGEQVRCAADGHVQLALKRLFDGKTPKNEGAAVDVGIFGDARGRSLSITIEEKDAEGKARRESAQLMRQLPGALDRYWREITARQGFLACAEAAAAP